MKKPTKRSHCKNSIRPCPWISCKHHMIWFVPSPHCLSNDQLLDKVINMKDSCDLDISDNGGVTEKKLAVILGLSLVRIRQILGSENKTMGAIDKILIHEDLHKLRSYL